MHPHIALAGSRRHFGRDGRAVLLFSVAFAQTPTLIVVRALPVKRKKGETSSRPATAAPSPTSAKSKWAKSWSDYLLSTCFEGTPCAPVDCDPDSEEMLGAAGQFDEINKFFADMPPNVEIGVGWLLQGNVKVVQPFTTDRDLAGKALIAKAREEAANPKNDNGNPYQCLRNLPPTGRTGIPANCAPCDVHRWDYARQWPGAGERSVESRCRGRLPVAGAGRDRSLPVLLDGPHRCGPKPGPRGTARGTKTSLNWSRTLVAQRSTRVFSPPAR